MPEDGRIRIDKLGMKHREWAGRLLREAWRGPVVVTRGRAIDATLLAGFVALEGERPVGLVTYRIEGQACEITTLNSLLSGKGVGSALIRAVKDAAEKAGCRRLWLVTTNDNMPALRFYQKRGFALAALYRDALDVSRQLKPQIPDVGLDGIPLRDEIELEMVL